MAQDDPQPESDRQHGVPHPRHAAKLFGHKAAIADFMDAYHSGRMPHAWMLVGPQGIGKATFAWAAARFLLTQPMPGDAGLFGGDGGAQGFHIDPDTPTARRMAALSESGLCLLRKSWDEKTKRFKTQLTVDEIRGLKSFFALSAGGNGRRVVIIDSPDDMNTSAANALLKELEEPPADTTLFLISHRPGSLLPTIRSRCRVARFAPLGQGDLTDALHQAGIAPPDDMQALAHLSGGSVGEAARLIHHDGVAFYADLIDLFKTLPRLDRARILALAERAGARGAEDRFELILSLVEFLCARLARTGASGTSPPDIIAGEAMALVRLAATPHLGRIWADLGAKLPGKARQAQALNLDGASVLLDMMIECERDVARFVQP